MSKTMATVLETHPEPEIDNGYWYCTCGHDYGVDFTNADVAAHQEWALSAAGFGLVADAKAEALEEAAAVMDKSAEALLMMWGDKPMNRVVVATLNATRHEARRVRNRAAALRGDS